MSEKAQLRKHRDWEVQDRQRLENAVNAMLQHTDTRFFLLWLLEIGKVGIQPFAAERTRTDFNCGEYNVGLQIFALITSTNPEGYITMLKEQQSEHGSRKSADARYGGYAADAGPDEDLQSGDAEGT